MDQLKQYLRILKRQHFWVVSALVLLVGVVSWFLTVGSLASQQTEFEDDIGSSFDTAQNVGRIEDHKNREVLDAMKALIDTRRAEVEQAWEKKYQQQSGGSEEENILKWPAEIVEGESWGPEFLATVQQLRPIETAEKLIPPLDYDEQVIRTFMRQHYRDYIDDELPKLAERIRAIWSPAEDGRISISRGDSDEEPSGSATGRQNPSDSVAVVLWDPADQERIQREHFTWPTSYARAPSSLELMYAQEDLWVFTALVDIIKRVNGNPSVRHNAAVKEIEFIKIGKSAGGATGQIYQAIQPGTSVDQEASTEEEDYGDPAVTQGEGDDGRVFVDPADRRYVDKDYTALSATELRSKATSSTPQDAYLRVAKRMPIRMRVKMDQREIYRLLAECANYNLTVQVRQLRVNPSDGVSRAGGGTSVGLSRGIGSMLDRETGSSLWGRSTQGFERGRGGENFADNAFPWDVTAEIYGIIYIYNPPDKAVLGGGEEV